MTYDYEAKGRADQAAGRKDDQLYGNGERHGADYRKGWQQARRDAEAAAELLGTVLKAPEVAKAAAAVLDAAFPAVLAPTPSETPTEAPACLRQRTARVIPAEASSR